MISGPAVPLGLAAALLILSACETRGPLAELEAPAELALADGQDWYLLGVQMLATREPSQAERAFNRSLAVEGVSARALTGLAIASAQQGMLTRARNQLETARRIAPEDVAVHNNLGVVLYDLGEYHAARQSFQTAFLLSSGGSEVAALNLEKAEAAIALTESGTIEDPAISHVIQRMGENEYRLLETNESPSAGAGTGTPG